MVEDKNNEKRINNEFEKMNANQGANPKPRANFQANRLLQLRAIWVDNKQLQINVQKQNLGDHEIIGILEMAKSQILAKMNTQKKI